MLRNSFSSPARARLTLTLRRLEERTPITASSLVHGPCEPYTAQRPFYAGGISCFASVLMPILLPPTSARCRVPPLRDDVSFPTIRNGACTPPAPGCPEEPRKNAAYFRRRTRLLLNRGLVARYVFSRHTWNHPIAVGDVHYFVFNRDVRVPLLTGLLSP